MANYQIHELTSGTIDRDSNVIHDTLNGGNYETRKATAGAVADLANVNVAALYDSSTTYAIGQYCLYEGNIYRCIAITTGAFDSTKWTQIVVTGEFRRVVELTSAQYSALSSAEKNNGTLYVITDEETTAADIPYSAGVSVADKLDNVPTFDTLTTSDNNKLLGISVSGSDISVGAVNPLAYSEGILTMDNTYIDTTEVNNWCRKGNIVEFHLTAKVKSNFTVNNRFAYGLPTPAKTGRMLGISTGNPDKIFRFTLNANGELIHAYSTAVPVANDVIELHGVYICT